MYQLCGCVPFPHRCWMSERGWWRRELWLGIECLPFPWLTYLGPGWLRKRLSTEMRQRAQESGEDLSHYLLVPTQDCPCRWGEPCRNAVLADMGEVLHKLAPVWWRDACFCTVCMSPAAALQSRSWVCVGRCWTKSQKEPLGSALLQVPPVDWHSFERNISVLHILMMSGLSQILYWGPRKTMLGEEYCFLL